MASLAKLLRSRKSLQANLTRHLKFIEKFSEGNIEELHSRVSDIKELYKKFNDLQIDIEGLDENAVDESDYINFEEKYYKALSLIQTHIKNKTLPSAVNASSNESNEHVSNVKLPTLDLPTFSGKFAEWFSFHDTFDALINQNKQLNNCQKFHYLKSCLKDDARRAVDALSISNENYKVAWDILNERYNNKRLVVQEHLTAILSVPQLNNKSNYSDLRSLLDTVRSNIEALKVLNLPTEHWDVVIVQVVSEKLDLATQSQWQETLTAELPKYSNFISFLEKRCQLLESLSGLQKAVNPTKSNQNVNKRYADKNCNSFNKVRNNSYIASKINCPCCKKGAHPLYQCLQFLRLSVSERINEINKWNICSACLKSDHKVEECRSKGKCGKCSLKHNSLIHIDSENNVNSHTSADSAATQVSVNFNKSRQVSFSVLLSTAVIVVEGKDGRLFEVRALLDVGSQSNFITESLCKRLGLKGQLTNIAISGIGQSFTSVRNIVPLHIKSRINSFNVKINCLVLPKITDNLPSETFNLSEIQIPNNIKLADPNFNISGPIDVLLGAEIFWQLLCVGQIKSSRSQPIFQKTHLGWIIGGGFPIDHAFNKQTSYLALSANTLTQQVSKFWELEECASDRYLTPEERSCENHFNHTFERDATGRFIIRLPFKDNTVRLGTSYDNALKRYYSLEKKLNRDTLLREKYNEFMFEYLDLKHMEPFEDTEPYNTDSCYLPHHPVFKENDTGKKIRVVFDASSKTSNSLSLNDNLMLGAVVQDDLFSILLRFRIYQYVLSGDINKMYRQIRMHPDDTKYHKILWRFNSNEPLQTYKLTTLTYGTRPASFIATRCLKQLAIENAGKYPLAAKLIEQGFYMDDLLIGANSTEELKTVGREITDILASAGFKLHKWASNDPLILPHSVDCSSIVNFDKDGFTKTLGLIWNCIGDFLSFNVKSHFDKKITKRSILSITAQIFDPLGLLAPVTINAKIILQSLWSLKLHWDESVPANIQSTWQKFMNELFYLNDIRIPRCVLSFKIKLIQLHGFCDSSQQAYGAVVYIRSTDIYNNHSVKILCAKSRVAPLKTVSIPRLELCGALLLARLVRSVRSALNISINEEFFWTDSSIVLAWLGSQSNTLKTFVANRVGEIQDLTDINNWRHISTDNNPADLITRGLSPKQLHTVTSWFNGPDWLSKDFKDWPISNINFNNFEDNMLEKRNISLHCHINSNDLLIVIERYSSFTKLNRVFAYCLRFIRNCRNKNRLKNEYLTSNELKASELSLVRIVQSSAFPDDFNNLQKNQEISKYSKLRCLSPYLDDNNIIRLGGRLKNAQLTPDKKYPILLPKNSHFTQLLIVREHERQLHAGFLATLASLRQKYWILSARSIIKRMIFQCIKCFRTKPKFINQKMGDLPAERTQISRPFLKTAIDYCGPFLIAEGKGRGKRSLKAYVALFLCMCTKAVHLELVGDLTTESFLSALRRFIARRGHVSDIFSDNATNFVGAKRELKELFNLVHSKKFNSEITCSLTQQNINWHFIPPRSPHMGGIWEVNIKSIKFHLKRVMGNARFTYEVLYTLLTRIEACLNSRPLTPISPDPNDLSALTPGHFLIGDALNSMVEEDVAEVPVNRLSMWQHIEKMRQHFWKRWSKEYLTQLQGRSKWHFKQPNIAEGTLVVIVEDNLPPLQWLLGRVTQVHPGSDGIVRVVSVKTKSGVIKRAVNRVCVLPINNDD